MSVPANGSYGALLATLALALAAPAAQAEETTSYCLTGTMADGSQTRAGSLAHNGYPLGTRLWARPRVFGRHRWTVRDRIGWGTEADFWAPSCGQAVSYGCRTVRLTVGWRYRVGKVRKSSRGLPPAGGMIEIGTAIECTSKGCEETP